MEMTLKMGAFEALDENEMLAVDGGKINWNAVTPENIIGVGFVITGCALMLNPGTAYVGAVCLDAATMFF